MKPDRAPTIIRMDASDPMNSPTSLDVPRDDSVKQHNPSETSNRQALPRTRAKYRTMVSLLNSIEENSPTTRSPSTIGAKEESIEPPGGDFTPSELSRTARDYNEARRRPEIEQVSDLAISRNKQFATNGDYSFDSIFSAVCENATPERKPSSGSSEHPKGRHLNSHGATSIPASLEHLRVDRSEVVGLCLNRRSKSLSEHLNSESIYPTVSGPSPYNFLSESKEPGDNRGVYCVSSAQQQDVCTSDYSKGYVRHRRGSGDSSGSLSVCSEGGNSCKIAGNGASTVPVEMRPLSRGWVSDYDEDLSGLDVVLFRPLGAFDPDVDEDETPIVSSRGTVRGMRNKVKIGIAVFDENQDTCKASHGAHISCIPFCNA